MWSNSSKLLYYLIFVLERPPSWISARAGSEPARALRSMHPVSHAMLAGSISNGGSSNLECFRSNIPPKGPQSLGAGIGLHLPSHISVATGAYVTHDRKSYRNPPQTELVPISGRCSSRVVNASCATQQVLDRSPTSPLFSRAFRDSFPF